MQQENISPTTRRPGNAFTRFSAYAALPGALLSALWITAGRSLLGAGGSLVPVFAISFGPLLLLVLLLAAHFARKEMKLAGGSRAGFTPSVAITQLGAWILALIFGLLVPDRQADTTVSAAASIFGPDFIGLSAGFGNTFGILTYCLAFAALLCAISTYRRARRLSLGLTDEKLEEAERQASGYAFLDD